MRLARYARWAGRAASTFALSWLYSITAANFMRGSRHDLVGWVERCLHREPHHCEYRWGLLAALAATHPTMGGELHRTVSGCRATRSAGKYARLRAACSPN